MTQYPTISTNTNIQTLYLQIRKNLANDAKRSGKPADDLADHRFAEMLATRSPPRAVTDREFLEGWGTLDKQFNGDQVGLKSVVEGAQRQGYNPTTHAVYMAPLARTPGDPEAFITSRSDVKRICEKRGIECRGAVNVRGRGAERDAIKNPKKLLGDDIVDAEVKKQIKRNPKADKRALREEVIAKHSLKL